MEPPQTSWSSNHYQARAAALRAEAGGPRAALKENAALLFTLVGVMWAVEIVDFVLPFIHLDALGIRPRTLGGLLGILLAPFLHGGFGHLAANTIPFLVLGALVLLSGREIFFSVSLLTALISGGGIWLFASGIHIGVSGVVFGYLGFLLGRAFHDRKPGSVIIAFVALTLYGGMLWGLLPTNRFISWQGHLFGFLGGLVASAWLTRTTAAKA